MAISPDAVAGELQAIAFKVVAASPDSANSMAEVMRNIVRHYLSLRGRSAPGSPPAMRSGRLRNSVTVKPATGGPVAEASVSPHTIYASIQEYGGEVWPTHHKFMHWAGRHPDGVFVRTATLPARPYMRPAAAAGVASGAFSAASVTAFVKETGL